MENMTKKVLSQIIWLKTIYNTNVYLKGEFKK